MDPFESSLRRYSSELHEGDKFVIEKDSIEPSSWITMSILLPITGEWKEDASAFQTGLF
jgi:hypothetical protein